jgi:hypothetical protein
MTLADFLTRIAETYDRSAPMSSTAQRLLRRAEYHLSGYVPGGILIMGSGGKGRPTHTPWVGFFDPDETETPESGIYVVYLFSADLSIVSLCVMQGITELTRKLGPAQARERLTQDARAIRAAMSPVDGWDTTMQLASVGFRQLAYEAGTIVARGYATSSLPDDSVLRKDLSEGLAIYQRAIQAKRYLLQARPGEIGSSSTVEPEAEPGRDPLSGFKPKSHEDYVAFLAGRVLIKSRRHERLINEFSAWAVRQGFDASSEHPVDLVLRRQGASWLVEGKVLYAGNATQAVRAALGQLYAYRHFLYPLQPDLRLLALFAEPIGDAFASFLEEVGVASVWRVPDAWAGSDIARDAGLTGSVELAEPLTAS